MISIDGRPVVSRADLHEKYGYATSTLERWWADRENNGHPPILATIGNAMYWDAELWEAWDVERRGGDTSRWATRAELAQHAKISEATLNKLWADRENNDHPDAETMGGILRWFLPEWDQWYTEYLQSEQQARVDRAAAKARAIGRTGDPDEEVGPAEAARILGHKDTSTVSHNMKNPPPGWPQPDSWDDLASGRRRPKWKRRKLWAYADSSSARSAAAAGRRTGSRNQAAHPYAGDPRLDAARQLLAVEPDITTGELVDRLSAAQPAAERSSASAWRRIISTARQHPTETP